MGVTFIGNSTIHFQGCVLVVGKDEKIRGMLSLFCCSC